MSSTLPLQFATSGISSLEKASQGYSFLEGINNDDDTCTTELLSTSAALSTTVRKNDMATDTDTNRGSFTEDETSSLDDEGMERSRTGRLFSKDDSSKLYHTAPHRASRVSQIPAARAVMKRDYSLAMSKRRQLEDLENSNFSEETIQQIRSTLIQSGKYLNRFCKIAEQQSSSDPDSDYEPSHKGRHRKYASNKFTHCIQHKVQLVKTDCSLDFGFSISDSASEPGIYIHQLKPGGPAEVNGLQPYDRILKVSY